MEHNNHLQGRAGSETIKMPGPVRRVKDNGTMGGGINRSLKGSGAGKHEY